MGQPTTQQQRKESRHGQHPLPAAAYPQQQREDRLCHNECCDKPRGLSCNYRQQCMAYRQTVRQCFGKSNGRGKDKVGNKQTTQNGEELMPGGTVLLPLRMPEQIAREEEKHDKHVSNIEMIADDIAARAVYFRMVEQDGHHAASTQEIYPVLPTVLLSRRERVMEVHAIFH